MYISLEFSGFQGEVLVQILDFPLCCIHVNVSLSSKYGEDSQVRETFSPKLPPRLSPGAGMCKEERMSCIHLLN